MKEAIVQTDLYVKVHDAPIPTPGPSQLVIKVIVSGQNPKDWKIPILFKEDHNPGDDIAGIVHAVGDEVTEFRVGDRVAAFHEMFKDHGSYAERVYPTIPTFSVQHSSPRKAATIPLAAMTAAIGLYQRLSLPLPWQPTTEPIPLLIYGGATAVGAFALKLASLSNIHPLITVAGRGIPFVESLLDKSKGDMVIDYRKGDESVVSEIKTALGGRKLKHAYDGVSEGSSARNIGKVLDPTAGSLLTYVLTLEKGVFPPAVKTNLTMVGDAHNPAPADSEAAKQGCKIGTPEFAYVMFRFFGRGLAKGWFEGHPFEIRKGGLGGLEGGLKDLKAGKVSAKKFVYRIGETEGVEL
ncbi:MAG: hypothetical protein M1834_005827 [Cirrosporium novae-zelandiae]|nr:MAG: hypothetical protein M1834_005827 [Cirrosporium novae-zelandiae]